MRFIVSDQPDWIGAWVAERVGFEYIPGRMTAIGLVDENEKVLGGVVFYDYTGTNIWMHVASSPDMAWRGSREFLWAVFNYVFLQLGCTRCSGWVPALNEAAIRLDKRLGFKIEHAMLDAGPEGTHYLMSLYRNDCEWIKE